MTPRQPSVPKAMLNAAWRRRSSRRARERRQPLGRVEASDARETPRRGRNGIRGAARARRASSGIFGRHGVLAIAAEMQQHDPAVLGAAHERPIQPSALR